MRIIANDDGIDISYDKNAGNEITDFLNKHKGKKIHVLLLGSQGTACDEKIIHDNLIHPSALGKEKRFKDLQELLNYILDNIKIFSVLEFSLLLSKINIFFSPIIISYVKTDFKKEDSKISFFTKTKFFGIKIS